MTIKKLILSVLFCMTLIATADIILLNLYVNAIIDLPHALIWNGFRAAYDLYLFPSTLLADLVFIGLNLSGKVTK